MKDFILKLKASIYRYTGVYLAHKEQADYVDSPEYWKQMAKILKSPKNDMYPSDIHGLLIGSWQAHYGFARPIGPLEWSRFRIRVKYKYRFLSIPVWFINNMVVNFISIKWDLQDLYKTLTTKKKKRRKKK
jgi:hypothetical protein